MRTLDLFLATLGLVALGLMFSNAPSVHARSTEKDQTGLTATGLTATGLTSTEAGVAGFGEGVIEGTFEAGESGEARPEESESTRCCASILLTPAERAARARVLEQVLTPLDSAFDRVRLGLLLQHQVHLTDSEERDIS
ncbi:MAG: hypothetical protein ACI9K5_001449 [Gammaproteobacteria bacterium]|jgi:hypothetical protein